MNKNLMKRLIALVLTGGILLSSTGVYTALATEETTSEYTSALVGSTDASETTTGETITKPDSTSSETTVTEETTATVTESLVEKPATTTQSAVTTTKVEITKPQIVESVVTSPVVDNKSDETTSEESTTSSSGTTTSSFWIGVNGTHSGEGTEANPWNISTVEHFLRMNEKINQTANVQKYFKLTANLDFADVTFDSAKIQELALTCGGVNAIVSVNPALSSNENVFFVLDGDNHSISNISINVSDLSYVSVFGYLNTASSIKNLFVSKVSITNSNQQAMAAGLILKNDGAVNDCNLSQITVDMSNSKTQADSFMIANDTLRVYSGASCGVVDNMGTIDLTKFYDLGSSPFSENKVTSGRKYTGTLVAQNRGLINKIRANKIEAVGTECVGGLVGLNKTARSSSLTGIFNIDITMLNAVKGTDKVGGVVGENSGKVQRTKVQGAYNSSKTTTEAANTILLSDSGVAGGVVGYNTGDVQTCSALNIGTFISSTASGATYGGIAGYSNYTIKNCVSTGTTNGAGTLADIERYVGGVVGKLDASTYGVNNCYTLVRILESKAVLGAVVGFGGDESYKAGNVKNNYYSSIISTRPSPVSYGAAGVKEGDLVFSKPYTIAYYDSLLGSGLKNEIATSQFSFSGWSAATISVLGNFTVPNNNAGATVTSSSSVAMIYTLNSAPTTSTRKTQVFYEVDITLPTGYGFETTVLSKEPMELGVINTTGSTGDHGSNNPTGAKGSEIKLWATDLWMLSVAPAAHFTVNTDLVSESSVFNVNDTHFSTPITFWGSVDLGGHSVTYSATKPFFKGVYGSRDDSMSIYNSSTHTSSSADADDTTTNLANGVVKNMNIELFSNSTLTLSNLFGDICNATVKNVEITRSSDMQMMYPSEANSGIFAKTVYGNSYIYGCYVDMRKDQTGDSIIYTTNDLDAISGFIGTIDAENAVIDNCGANVVIDQTGVGSVNNAVFVGKIKSLGGAIVNSYAAGGIRGSNLGSNNYIFAGEIASASTEIYNCYYSPSDYYVSTGVYKGAADGIRKGSFTGTCGVYSFVKQNTGNNDYSNITMVIANNTTDIALINNVQNIARLSYVVPENSSLMDFFTASSSNTSVLTTGAIRQIDDYPAVTYTFSGTANANANLRVVHNSTGLMARLSVYNSSDLEIDSGYYIIKTPIELYYLITHQADMSANGEYIYLSESAKIKIADNIDMTGYSIDSFGTSSNPFQGEFVADKGTDGQYYTISNLSYDGMFTGFFGYVKGATITGIHLDNVDSIAGSNAAVLVNTVYGNANISDCKVTNSTVSAPYKSGAIAGIIQVPGSGETTTITSVINNCTVENTTITSTTNSNAAQIGGIVGTVGQGSGNDNRSANIKNCTVKDCKITANSYQVGGIVGYADHIDNTIEGCTVVNTNIYSTDKSISKNNAFLGGIAGSFGGKLIDNCTVDTVTVSGPGAAGIVTNLMNLSGTTSTISNCTVTNSNIIAENVDTAKFAGGIMSIVSPASNYVYNGGGDKVVSNCKISADTTVKSAVAGGIIGNVDTFSGALTVSGCTNLGTIETTGRKGASADAAGGIIGRIATLQDTSKMSITGCLSQGTLKGVSILGGVIGVHSGKEHPTTSENKLITDTYVTSDFSSTNLAVVKGLIIGSAGSNIIDANRSIKPEISSNVVYSSLDNDEPLFGGGVTVTAANKLTMVYDMQLGEDQTTGLSVDVAEPIDDWTLDSHYVGTLTSIVGYKDGMLPMSGGAIQLKTNHYFYSQDFPDFSSDYLGVEYNGNYYEADLSWGLDTLDDTLPRFSIGNLPVIEDTDGALLFTHPEANVFTTDVSENKLIVGEFTSDGFTDGYNTVDSLTIQTMDKKCQADVYTTYTGTINGETVAFKVGFIVVVKGIHAFDGDGTIDNPFIIRDAEDLLSIKQHHDAPLETDPYYENSEKYYAADTYYEVVNDIDVKDELNGLSFAPIGTKDEPFKATISSTNGSSFKISNVTIADPKESTKYAYNTDYGEDAEYSAAFGVFGYTDGATISNLEFENVNIYATPDSNDSPGLNVGGVVGYAKNTTISNVKVTGALNINIQPSGTFTSTKSAGGIVGFAGDNVVLSNVSVIGASADEKASVASIYAVGGIVGSSEATVGTSITNARVENVIVENRATSGKSAAGSVAGIFDGIITGSYTEEIELDENNNPVTVSVRTPVVVSGVTVTGNCIGGVVGTTSELTQVGLEPTQEITMVDVSNVALNVTQSSEENITNGTAGGILGQTGQCYAVKIDDCTVDSNTVISTGLTAGGIVGKFNGPKISGVDSIRSSLSITNCKSYAKITQQNAPKDSDLSVKYTADIVGIGGILGVATVYTRVMNEVDNSASLKIHNSTAGGEVIGTYNIGGIAGQIASNRPAYNLEESVVYNCIVAAKIGALNNVEITRVGIIFGAVEANTRTNQAVEGNLTGVFPAPGIQTSIAIADYKINPIDKVFYSSYTTTGFTLYGKSEINDYQGVDTGNTDDDGNTIYENLFAYTVYDVNEVVYRMDNGDEEVELPIGIVKGEGASAYQNVGFGAVKNTDLSRCARYDFSQEFKDTILANNDGSGDPLGFTLAGASFVLAENGVSSSNTDVFTVQVNDGSSANMHADKEDFPYYIQGVTNETADLVFTYTNGLQIGIPLICGVSYEGEGTFDKPILVSSEAIFRYIVPTIPNYVFKQTVDLDFTDDASFANGLYKDEYSFGGVYLGNGHKITGLNLTGSDTAKRVSVFGTVTDERVDENGDIVANIQDLTFVDCTVTAANSEANVGIVASEIKNNASMKNVHIVDSTVTATGGNVGGIVGKISGTATLENVSVTGDVGSTISSDSGSVGGIVGIITDATAVITDPVVANTTVQSGTIGSDGVFSSTKEDIAGGIVAEAVGTINGANELDENGDIIDENLYKDAVSGVTVKAFISGGAVGATYKSEIASDNVYDFNLNNIRVVNTDVTSRSSDATQTMMSAAGLLGRMGDKTNVSLYNSYVDSKCTLTSDYLAGGAVGYTWQSDLCELNITDTECYADINVTQVQKDSWAVAGGLIGYINSTEGANIDLNNITMNGSVAGGKVSSTGYHAYAGGAVGYIQSFVTSEVNTPFFVNGVISAEVYTAAGENNVQSVTPTLCQAKFIAGFNDGNFPTDEADFMAIFNNNYYSSYPQNINFFTSQTGSDIYTDIIKADTTNIDVNAGANLMLSKNSTDWNRVAIIGAEGTIKLFAKLNIPVVYGSVEDADAKKTSLANLEAVTITSANSAVALEGTATAESDDTFSFVAEPKADGAGYLVVQYTCGLKTSAPIICVEMDGTGDEDDPFLVENATHLYVVGSLGQTGTYFRQVNDIDLTNTYNESGASTDEYINYNDGKGFEPIGNTASPFAGNYDGQGYKITGLYINRNNADDVGLFGVTNNADIRNIHLELMPADGASQEAKGVVGKERVGGLIGNASSTTVVNCSVALGAIAGKDTVGGLIGTASNPKIENCFTQSDVGAYGVRESNNPIYSAGIVAEITSAGDGSYIKGSFVSGSIYATANDTLTDFSYASGIVGYLAQATDFVISDCLFTGSTAGGYGILSNASSVNMTYTVSNCIDAGMNVAMDDNVFTSLNHKPVTSVEPNGESVIFTELYYDNALLKVNSDNLNGLNASIKGEATSSLISENRFASWNNWDTREDSYPSPKVSSITVTTYDGANSTGSSTVVDPYSQAYAMLLSVPVQISEAEEESNPENAAYGKGLVYPVTIKTNVDGNKITYSSSIFDTTDTVAYPDGYDVNLYGIGENKNVDLLFEDKADGLTTVYRNIFDTTANVVKKTEPDVTVKNYTRVIDGAQDGKVFTNGEAYYNTQVPLINAVATVNGVEVHREIKIPLSYGTTYPIATQRQLFALGMADNETAVPNSKFCNYYGEHFNYKLITDIDCSTSTAEFNPIGYATDNGYTGQFDGSGHKIIGLTISKSDAGDNPVGLFARVSTDFNTAELATVKNLTLENCTVHGGNVAGTLVGHVKGEDVTIENCHVYGVADRTADDELDSNTLKGVIFGSGEYLGGLIGKVDYPSDVITKCSATNAVFATGKSAAVGGLIGHSAGTVDSCYATGNVVVNTLRPYQSGVTDSEVINGIGGLIGVVTNVAGVEEMSTVKSSFASGNVEVEGFGGARITREQNGIGGFIGYLGESSVTAVEQCFSGGNVEFGTGDTKPTLTATISGTSAMVGVGGFIGITKSAIEYCYSSAAVTSELGAITKTYGNYGVGVGGVVGIARDNVSDVYSSGSVSQAYITTDDTDDDSSYNDIGGTVGTIMETSAETNRCFFDKWTNSDPDLKSVGGKDDSTVAGSLTTVELTGTTAPTGFAPEGWGYTENAYPYLTSLLTDDADDDIKVNSILSVICVKVNDDDVSVKQGLGLTMAIEVPTTFKYSDELSYTLNWTGANLEGNFATPVRTRNTAEYVDVIATIEGYEENGSRVYRRLCADMRGTYEQPYLIGSLEDFEHINMTQDELDKAVQTHPDLYGQWATPLGDGNNQVEGTVHYRLSGNIDATGSIRRIPSAPASYTFKYTELEEQEDGTTVSVEKEFTVDYAGFNLAGNAYSVKNVTSDGYFIANLDENSTVSNVNFENLAFTSTENTALVSNNKGQIVDVYVKSSVGDGEEAVTNTAGLVLTNDGTIDGCVVDITLKGAESNVGVMAVNNNGTIKNSGTAGTVNTVDDASVSNIGAFVVNNNGTISSSFSMADVDVLTAKDATVTNVSGFAATSSGTIDSVYTRTALSFANVPSATTTIASLVGTLNNNTQDAVKNSYAIGLLGYFNENQDSILFGTVPSDMPKLDSVFVDKLIAGQKSYNSFKYAASTQSLMEMKQMPETAIYDEINNPNGAFIKGTEGTNTFPQLSAILNAENTAVVDPETKEPIEIENGTIIRNYDVIKAYSAVSSMALKTAYGQYADRLAADSSNESLHGADLRSLVSSNTEIEFNTSNVSIVAIDNSTTGDGVLTTAKSNIGKVTLTAYYRLGYEPKLTRGSTVEPKLYIDVETTTDTPVNPNFNGGLGTEANPYVIHDADALQSLIYYGTDNTLYFKLGNDIDMTGYEFEQIPVFSAHINKGVDTQYAIENLTSTDGGIFGVVEQGAVINNIAIAGADITSDGKYTGALADEISGGTVTNCVVSATVTSNYTEADAATGVLAGWIGGNATVDNIVTTGDANALNGAVGGVAGHIVDVTISNAVSTANIPNLENAGGIVGTMGESSEINNVLYAGVALNKKPIVSSVTETSTVTNAYYDKQLTVIPTEEAEEVIGTAKTTSQCADVFSDNASFTSKASHYPIPVGVANAAEDSSFAKTVDLATMNMIFYLGSSTGEVCYYTSMRFDNIEGMTVTEVIDASESDHPNHFNIELDDDGKYTVRTVKYTAGHNPSIVITLPNGAIRTIKPGLVLTANIAYTVEDSIGLNGTYSVLIKSVKEKGSQVDVNVISDFTTKTNKKVYLDSLIVSDNVKGFYVGDMLKKGYKYEISAKLNGEDITDNLMVEEGIYGTFVSLDAGEGVDDTNVELTLKVVEETKPWGVQSKNSTLK